MSKTLSVKSTINNSARAITLKDAWETNELTFNAMKREADENFAKAILLTEIGKMVLLLKADMQEAQIEYLADYILHYYPSYTISDLTTLTARLVEEKSYGKPILQTMIYELDQYSISRQEFAVAERMKENSEYKQKHLKPDKFNEMYSKLKLKAQNNPPKSQKEKDAEAIDRNNQKIEEMKKKGLL